MSLIAGLVLKKISKSKRSDKILRLELTDQFLTALTSINESGVLSWGNIKVGTRCGLLFQGEFEPCF